VGLGVNGNHSQKTKAKALKQMGFLRKEENCQNCCLACAL
jgi:hypothetical protein